LVMSFGHHVIWHWSKLSMQRIEHKYAIVGLALCVMEDVQKCTMMQLRR
jgi:hypothetical protein